MKKFALGVLCAILPLTSFAASYSGTGLINKIVAIAAGENRDYILVDGFGSAGDCPTSRGLVVAKFQSTEGANRAYSLALAAKMAGKRIRLVVDDSSKNHEGVCFVVAIEVTD